MADSEQLAIISHLVWEWNVWRQRNPHIRPDLGGADLSEGQLGGANLYQADLRGARLDGANLAGALLAGADLHEAKLKKADLSEANLSKANLTAARLVEADLWSARLPGADLKKANLFRARLDKADLREADLTGANLTEARFCEAKLNDAIFSHADGGKAQLISADLRGSNFCHADFGRADFFHADLSDADLRGADFFEANLRDAKLAGSKLVKAHLFGANLTQADLTRADLREASLSHAVLVETKVSLAHFSGASVYGAAVWNLNGTPSDQANLLVTSQSENEIRVDDLEIAQFIYLLINHKKIRNAISAVAQRGVLILGAFSENRIEMLREIAAKLRERGYLPIIFDFERPKDKSYTETVQTLAGLSRFVIVELSGPSVPQELYATVPHFKIPFALLHSKGTPSYSMSADLREYPWVLPPFIYESRAHLLDNILDRIISEAEQRRQDRQKALDEIFGREQQMAAQADIRAG